MHKKDLDSDVSSRDSSRDPMSSGQGGRESMRNYDESGSGMSDSSEDLQRKQREGNLGNERVRGSGSSDDMKGIDE